MAAPQAWEVQEAVYAALSQDPEITAVLGHPARIHDAPPPDPEFPFVVIGQTDVKPIAAAPGAYGHEIRVEIISKYRGRREVKLILDAVHGSLHETPLSITGGEVVSSRFLFSDIFPRTESGAFRGVMKFRIVTQQNLGG
ncbi:MAG: DUF3168 domain-containing protein [Pseudomonadota bacterium]